ncbi:unnamed protein product [Vitrella brassicaformis CCMP3155]|uniref:t-SNARE coiled-coil homology domain-containing protein n=1 Tax=Vitrella brassicaformis (strain CCMP3155) TaxID=1169540 RepID=A0A0G4EZW2_VITBC|nr:unnamed protein product [Vitrella brassicaformis CCMP3155]|eukprot:CEM05171.1 unnamed protein product [Vitrella brassicaformis CCMP3155]
MASSLHGVDELLKRLERIQEECGSIDKAAKDRKDGPKDEFLRLKEDIYSALFEVKEAIRERQVLQKRVGNSFEVIQKGVFITDTLKSLDADFKKIQELYKKQSNQRRKFEETELESRFQALQIMKKQLEEAKTSFKTGGALNREDDIEIKTVLEQRAGLGLSAGGVHIQVDSTGGQPMSPTEDEERAMYRWKHRDAQFDKQVEEIGEGVERLGEIATQINVTADKQTAMAAEIQKTAEKASAELNKMNVKLKKFMEEQKNSNFFCRIILVICLIGCVGFIWNAVMK